MLNMMTLPGAPHPPNARIDDEIELQNVSEQCLGHRLHIGVIEIDLHAIALQQCGGLQRGAADIRILLLARRCGISL